jgi:hypothetical protein
MPNLARLFTVSALALFITGCGTPMRFAEYTGHDTSSYLGTWQVGPGTMAEGAHGGGLFTSGLAVPVYRGWPEKYYRVIGSLRFEDPNKNWGYDEGILKAAASEAKRHGGDAIIIRQGAEFGVSKIAGVKNDPLVLSSSQTTALVIKWLTEQEIRDMELRLEDFRKRFAANDPAVWANQPMTRLVMTYLLLQPELSLKSQQLYDRFAEVMTKIITRTPENPNGDYVFKATVGFSTVLSGGDERNYIGMATVSADGENLTIVSSGGTQELNLTGTMVKNRVTGQIGIGNISAKCEGAATPEKLSINFQSLTQDGTVTGNIVLQRLIAKPNDNEKTKPNTSVKPI